MFALVTNLIVLLFQMTGRFIRKTIFIFRSIVFTFLDCFFCFIFCLTDAKISLVAVQKEFPLF